MNMRKSAAVLAGVLVVVAWSAWANPQKTSSQPAPSANDQMISNYAQEMLGIPTPRITHFRSLRCDQILGPVKRASGL